MVFRSNCNCSFCLMEAELGYNDVRREMRCVRSQNIDMLSTSPLHTVIHINHDNSTQRDWIHWIDEQRRNSMKLLSKLKSKIIVSIIITLLVLSAYHFFGGSSLDNSSTSDVVMIATTTPATTPATTTKKYDPDGIVKPL